PIPGCSPRQDPKMESFFTIWRSVARRELSKALAHSSAIAVSADGSLVAAGNSLGIAQVWQLNGWKSIADTPVARRLEDRSRVRTLTFTPDRRSLVIARFGGESNEKGGLWMLPLVGRSKERRIAGHEGSVYDVDVAPDGKTLVSVGVD